jgi:hypothetical protein
MEGSILRPWDSVKLVFVMTSLVTLMTLISLMTLFHSGDWVNSVVVTGLMRVCDSYSRKLRSGREIMMILVCSGEGKQRQQRTTYSTSSTPEPAQP